MFRASIRELLADVIRNCATEGEVLGITSNGALVGVLVPTTADVLGRLSASGAEDDDPIDQGVEAGADVPGPVELTDLRQLLRDAPSSGRPSGFARVSVREISGARLKQASTAGEPLVVTSDRVTVAVFLPLVDGWVDRLVEESVNRFFAGQPVAGPEAKSAGAARTTRSTLLHATAGPVFTNQRAIGIRIVGDARHDRKRMVGVVTDRLARTNIDPLELELASLDEPYVLDRIRELINELLSRTADTDVIVGVGLEIGGHVYDGRVVRSANIYWNEFPFADRLAESIRLPVVLENDANALAIHEQSQAVIVEDFAVVLLTHLGVGCGLVLDGSLYRGKYGVAGEFGHIPIGVPAAGGRRCRCGNFGCLEVSATPNAIEDALRDAGYTGRYEDFLDARDEGVRKIFAKAGSALGCGLATILNLLSPEVVVLHGPPELLGPPRSFHIGRSEAATEADAPSQMSWVYSGAMVDEIRNHVFSSAATGCEFVIRMRSDEQGARAAAACVLRKVGSQTDKGVEQPKVFLGKRQ